MCSELPEDLRPEILRYQQNEITEHHIYERLARRARPSNNRQVLHRIAQDELDHYHSWREYTGRDVAPNRFSMWLFSFLARVFGFTFAIKLMEKGETTAQANYQQLRAAIPQVEQMIRDEQDHENTLIGMLDEERLRYAGSMVLGLNDALVELTGALAGLTLALQDTRLIALSGSITGVAAALSMGASEFLSTKTEETEKHPLRAALYTGGTYIITVLALILPYLLLDNYFVCLACTLGAAVLIIAVFNYYIAVAKDEPFRQRFLEMSGLSLSVAAFSFLVGYVIRTVLGVDV